MSHNVDSALMLDQIADFLRRYVVFPLALYADAVALWIAHTWTLDAAYVSPILIIKSPEKRSGKTLLLDLIELVARRPWRIVSPSEAVIFRKIEADQPALLLDEADTIFSAKGSNYEGLRALLNAGNRRGVSVPRCVGEGKKMAIQDFSIFCPKALAGIGRLPDTVEDRGAPKVTLKRRSRDETVARFRSREAHIETADLREALAMWSEDVTESLKDARPAIPDALNDRAAEAWEIMLAIADEAGGEWPDRARKAAVACEGSSEASDESASVQLLQDIRATFNEQKCDKLWTADLIDALCEIEEASWGDFYGKRISAHGVARLLKGYGIKPRVERIGKGVKRGYQREDFEDAWKRYLLPESSETASERYTVTTEAAQGEAADAENPVTDRETLQTSSNGSGTPSDLHRNDVTVQGAFPEGVPLPLYAQAEAIRRHNASLLPAPSLDEIPWAKGPGPSLR